MYGLTRSTLTLLGVAVAGLLLWLGSRVYVTSLDLSGGVPGTGRYWGFMGLVALAGLVMALSQLLGGWTKWGWPRLSVPVLLLGFLPTLLLGAWVLAHFEPGAGWLPVHVRRWSDDIGVESFVQRLGFSKEAIAFLIGLVFGFSFDTTGPRVKRAAVGEEAPATKDGRATDDRRVHIREGATPAAPQPEPEPEPAPRSGEPAKE